MTLNKISYTRATTTDLVRRGQAGASPGKPIDAIIIGTGPTGMVALRNLLRNDPPLSVVAVDRQGRPGGIWTGHIPAYSTLQDTKQEYEAHGVRFPQAEPARRAPRDQVADFCQAYHDEFGLEEHVLWQHEVVKVEMIKPMLHKIEVKDCSGEGCETKSTIFSRGVLVCTGDNFYPYTAYFPGSETATFLIKHNLDIRHADEIPDADVVVVGAGPSAMDMVQEACITRGATRVHLVMRGSHWGAPDLWWPMLWQFGFTNMHFLRVCYRLLPLFVVDAILYYINVVWAYLYGVSEWMPPEKYPPSAKPGYILRTHLVVPYKKRQFRIYNNCEIKSIQESKLTLTDGTVLYPKLVVAATGWQNHFEFLPGHSTQLSSESRDPCNEDGSRSFLPAVHTRRPLYLRFYDQDCPGIFYISIANGFMAATEGASYLSQCVDRILRGQWTPPDRARMERQIREVVLHHIAMPGRLERDLEEEGFSGLRGKDER